MCKFRHLILDRLSRAGTYSEGETALISLANKVDGVNFLRWEDADSNVLGTESSLSYVVANDETITAVVEDARPLPVSFYSVNTIVENPETGSIQGGGTYVAGSELMLEAKPAQDFSFIGWTGDLAGTSKKTSFTLNRNLSIEAVFGDPSVDSDRDSLPDIYEQIIGTDPSDRDTDDDGLYDGDEIDQHGTSPYPCRYRWRLLQRQG